MSSPPAEISLHALGTEIFEKFKRLVHESSDKSLSENYLSRVRLINEEERFLLWAHNLGLHQTGHVSLDYRLRAAIVVKDYVSEVLTEIKQNLDESMSSIYPHVLSRVKMIQCCPLFWAKDSPTIPKVGRVIILKTCLGRRQINQMWQNSQNPIVKIQLSLMKTIAWPVVEALFMKWFFD